MVLCNSECVSGRQVRGVRGYRSGGGFGAAQGPTREVRYRELQDRRHAPQAARRGSRARRTVRPTRKALFGQFTKQVSILLHDLAGERHLLFELRVVRRDAVAVRRTRKIESIAFLRSKGGERLLRKGSAH